MVMMKEKIVSKYFEISEKFRNFELGKLIKEKLYNISSSILK